jgi:hypothetical protein
MKEQAQHGWSPHERRMRPAHATWPDTRRAAAGSSRTTASASVCVREGDRQVVAAHGQLVAASAWQLERELRWAEATEAREILLDLAVLEPKALSTDAARAGGPPRSS